MPLSLPVRLLVVVPALGVGGTEQQLLMLLPGLVDRGFSVTLMVLRPRGALRSEFEAKGVHISAPRHDWRWLTPLVTFARVGWFLLTRQPSIIHTYLPEAYLSAMMVSLFVSPVKRVMSRRSLNCYQRGRPGVRALERWLHRRMDAVCANSVSVGEQLLREGVTADQLWVINNGIRFSGAERSRAACRKSLGIRDDVCVVITAASLLPYKGHAIAIEAFARAQAHVETDMAYLIAGRDEGELLALQHRAEILGVAPKIHWLKERADVADLLAASDIALLCSEQEGSPNFVIEAMGLGLPVVATNAGGIPEIVEDGESGFLRARGDAEGLGDRLVTLVNDEALRLRMGAAGKQRAFERHSMERCCTAHVEMYLEVSEGRR